MRLQKPAIVAVEDDTQKTSGFKRPARLLKRAASTSVRRGRPALLRRTVRERSSSAGRSPLATEMRRRRWPRRSAQMHLRSRAEPCHSHGALPLPRNSGSLVMLYVVWCTAPTEGPAAQAAAPRCRCDPAHCVQPCTRTNWRTYLVYSQWRWTGARPVRRHTRREVRPMPLHPCPPCQRVRCKPRDTMPSPPARDAPPSRSATQKPRAAHLRGCARAGLGDRVMLYAATARCVAYRS
jgi:hypothetical protein